ncbi:hypothetical protein Vi05172_g3787 [Venturia inaequalis]|nr:hypothetical protein Vi05172_g3787 [Venturia inaequalis]
MTPWASGPVSQWAWDTAGRMLARIVSARFVGSGLAQTFAPNVQA